MKWNYRARFIVALISTSIGGCSIDSKKMADVEISEDVRAEVSINQDASILGVRVRPVLVGEYANFSKRCSPHKSMIGAVRYPRLEKEFAGNGIAPTVVNSSDECPLHLVSIQAHLTDEEGRILARPSATYRPDLDHGEDRSSCYVSIGGPGYCLIENEQTAEQRQTSKSRLIGSVAIKWHK